MAFIEKEKIEYELSVEGERVQLRKYLLRMLAFIAMVLVIGFVSVFIPDLGNKEHMLYALRDKHAALDSLSGNGPKVILVGGSNLAFGMDSKMVSEELGMPVVNMAVHAALGLKFMLDDSRPFVEKGDIVVIVPEYPHFYDTYPSTFYGADELLTVVLDVLPGEVSYISAKQWTHLYRYLPKYIGNKYYGLVKFRNGRKFTGKGAAYRRATYNKFGDNEGHLDMKSYPAVVPPHVDHDVDQDVVDYLNDYQAFCESKEAKTFFSYTVIQDTGFYRTIKHIEKLEPKLEEELNMPILAPASKLRLPERLFFDSQEHLNKEGRELRTKMFIEDLKKKLDRE
ncbi:MAG: hypothetical protein AAFY71_05005 [Bacteroidota bacterium]